jgi:integrase
LPIWRNPKIKVEEMDFQNHRIRVGSKGRERIVYFGKQAATALKFYLEGRTTGPLFLDDRPIQRGQLVRWGRIWQARWREYPGKIHHTKYLGNPAKMSYRTANARFHSLMETVSLRRERHGITSFVIQAVVRRAGEKIGLKNICPRMIRHSFATHPSDPRNSQISFACGRQANCRNVSTEDCRSYFAVDRVQRDSEANSQTAI